MSAEKNKMAPRYTLSLDDFQKVTDEAFSFLMVDHLYTAYPAERGGRFGGFVRRFTRASYEIGIIFGDADSQHLCSVWFRDDVGQKIVESSYMGRDLVTLLARRYPTFAHPTTNDLSDAMTLEVVIRQYADLLRKYAIDIVEGDFSAFPSLMYVLHHVDRKFPARAVRRFLGIYSTYERATAAIEERSMKPGFSERLDGFEIWRVQPDGYGFWFAGIPLDEPRENNG
jgi:hypothetical protein